MPHGLRVAVVIIDSEEGLDAVTITASQNDTIRRIFAAIYEPWMHS